MSDILKYAQRATSSPTPKRGNTKWHDFMHPYYILREKGRTPSQAIRELAQVANLDEADTAKLMNSSKQWDRSRRKEAV